MVLSCPDAVCKSSHVGYIMQTLSIFQDYQINGMDTTVPPTQHQQNHDATNMEKCEMPNTVNVTDNNVNGGGRG